MKLGDGSLGKMIRTGAERPWFGCLVLSFAALFIHGYHPYAEDAGIYIPAVKQRLDPSLYPKGSEFFSLPAHWSAFTGSIAAVVRIFHLPLPYALLLCYLGCLFFTFVACWKIAELIFEDRRFGLVGTSLLAVTISMPATGCALLLSDPYVTSRSIATPLILFSIVHLLKNRYLLSCVCWLAAFPYHPLMAAISAIFLMLLGIMRSKNRRRNLIALVLVLSGAMLAASESRLTVNADYRAAALSRSYFFLNQWTWYELAGAAAPLVFFMGLAWKQRDHPDGAKFQVSWAAVLFGTLAILAAAAVTWIPGLFAFARLQPMRAFQLIYVLFILVPAAAALCGISSSWRTNQRLLAFSALLAVFACGMYMVQSRTFGASRHVEWPWEESMNPWQQAFAWIRLNTPKDAVFALDPDYQNSPGNDRQGFRAQAERSVLPDSAKDGGVAALFPQLAAEWKSSLELTTHLSILESDRANELRHAGVSWIVVQREGPIQLDCPYSNAAVSVCHLPGIDNSEGIKSASTKHP
jgi:hypothetical protein